VASCTATRGGERLADSFKSLTHARLWVAWREEIQNGRATKIPKNPATGRNASVPTDPSTYGTRAEAETRGEKIQGGLGIVLGELPDGRHLVGIDLDSCRDAESGAIADWAEVVLERFDTYAEVSPSGTGVKLFFVISAADFVKLSALIEGKTRKTFAAGEHREVAIDTARFYAVTEQRLSGSPEHFRLVPFDDAEWFITEVGPHYLEQQKSGNGRDESGSGYGFRFMRDRRVEGMSYAQAREAILRDEAEAGEWANRVDERQLKRAWGNRKPTPATAPPIIPVDLWGHFEPPALPPGLLPEVIEKFARVEGAAMGADPAGLVMAALTVCAAAISDEIKLQPKRHADFWTESARLWTSLVGDPSTMKTPIINQTTWPMKRLDKTLFQQYAAELAAYNALPLKKRKKKAPPKQRRVRIEDITIEAAQEVLKDSPDGVLCLQDELSGWFGSMDKYSGNRGAMKDRGFWLQSWNGGEYVLNRIGRGAVLIPNLSVSLLGGIQPEPMRKLAADKVDDGLLQRTCPIVLRPAMVGRDEPADPVNKEYSKLIDALHEMKRPRAGSDGNYFLASTALRFDDAAQKIRNELEQKHLDLQSFGAVSRKLSAHIGKYNGIFARLCVVFHCVENVGRELPITVAADTAERVAQFLHNFLLPHAVAFYAGVLGLSDDHDRLTAVAGYVLARKLDRITNRDVQRGDRTMRGLTRRDIERLFEQLDALGWINRIESKRFGDPPQWVVNPEVHRLFQERAKKEAARRSSIRAAIAGAIRKVRRD
jgi:hypothetical protein